MRTLRGQRGASAVEFALIAPVLFMLIFAILGFGIAFMQLQTIRGAVREGARISAVGATVSQVQQKVADASTGIVPAGQVAVTSCPGQNTTTLLPMFMNALRTPPPSPCPYASRITTDASPHTIPSMVSTDRMRFRIRACQPCEMSSLKNIVVSR